MQIEMQALTLAAAIQEAGSITGAAKRLGYSQPAVSQQLHRIEQRLGVAIVTRAGRGIRLTEAGQMLASRARSIQVELESAFGAVQDLAEGVTGHVRIAAFPSASSSLVPALLAEMRQRHPGIDVSFIEEEPPEAAAMLADGVVDLALTFSYADANDPHRTSIRGLASRKLFSEPVYVALPADHPQAQGTKASIAALADADWIAGCPRCRGHLLAVCEESGFAPRIMRETDNTIAVLGLVRAGLGVGLLPSIALASVGVPDGVRLMPTSPAGPRTIHAVTTNDARRAPAVAAALDAIDDVVRELGLAA